MIRGSLSTHVISSLGFFSNLKYLSEAGYFDVASHEKWLLHTWSLSVEWQFYIFFPIILRCVWALKPGREFQVKTISIFFLISFLFCVDLTISQSSRAFFLLQARAWEMLGGGLVLLFGKDMVLSSTSRRWFEMCGFILIATSILVFDANSTWPGWRALVPVAGAMMVLMAERSSIITGNSIVQWLGDRSYSVYLWHWPIFVALTYAEIQGKPLAAIYGIGLTLIIGNFSYLLVERNGRQLFRLAGLNFVGGSAFVLIFVVALSAFTIRSFNGVSDRFPPSIELVADEANNINPRRKECNGNIGPTSPSCIFGGKEWKVIAIGDSHVAATISGLVAASTNPDSGVVQWSYSACPFVPGVRYKTEMLSQFADGFQCEGFIEWAERKLEKISGDVSVVLIGRYAQMALGHNEDHLSVDVPQVFFTKPYSISTPEFLEEFGRHITESACKLAKQRTVYMMRPIPEMGFDVPKATSRRMDFGLEEEESITLDDYFKRNAWVWAAQDAARSQCGVRILDPIPYLCHDGRCYGSHDGRPIYSDDDHLSEFGNKLLIPMFRAVFSN